MKRSIHIVVTCLLWLAVTHIAVSQSLHESLEVTEDLHRQAVQSQRKIDQMADQTEALLEEYQRLLLDADYHQTQLDHLTRELQQQKLQREKLQQQIDQIQLTEKRLAPLLGSMVQTLERFIIADLPFHHRERIDSVLLLRERMQDAGLPLVDRFQLVMEAYQIELEYGHTLESYRTQLEWQGQTRSMECLRVGRLALYFLSPDGAEAGYWNPEIKQWQALPARYNRVIRDGLSVANSQLAPKLLSLPLAGGMLP